MYWSLPGTNLKKVPGSVPRWERMTDRISRGAMLLPMRYRCGGPAENIPASGHIRLIRWENATCAGLLECRIADRAGGEKSNRKGNRRGKRAADQKLQDFRSRYSNVPGLNDKIAAARSEFDKQSCGFDFCRLQC